MKIFTRIFELFFVLAIAACSTAPIVKFCTTDQPVIGAVAPVVTQGVAATHPAATADTAIAGIVVQDVSGLCAALPGAEAAPPPPAGAKVVVPAKAP